MKVYFDTADETGPFKDTCRSCNAPIHDLRRSVNFKRIYYCHNCENICDHIKNSSVDSAFRATRQLNRQKQCSAELTKLNGTIILA